jgi:hypothetical protein
LRDIDELRRGNLARGIGILTLPEEFLRLAANSFIGKVKTRRGQGLVGEQKRTEQKGVDGKRFIRWLIGNESLQRGNLVYVRGRRNRFVVQRIYFIGKKKRFIIFKTWKASFMASD